MKERLTSCDEQHLDPKVGITHTDQEEIFDFVKLEVIIPEVAHELLDVLLKCAFVVALNVVFHVLGLRYVSGDVNVHDTEIILNRPVNVERHSFSLSSIDTVSHNKREGKRNWEYSQPMHYVHRVSHPSDQEFHATRVGHE